MYADNNGEEHRPEGTEPEDLRSNEMHPKFICPFPVCVKSESPRLQLWQLRGANPNNVVVGSDIDDTLIASGGWMIRSSYLGGSD